MAKSWVIFLILFFSGSAISISPRFSIIQEDDGIVFVSFPSPNTEQHRVPIFKTESVLECSKCDGDLGFCLLVLKDAKSNIQEQRRYSFKFVKPSEISLSCEMTYQTCIVLDESIENIELKLATLETAIFHSNQGQVTINFDIEQGEVSIINDTMQVTKTMSKLNTIVQRNGSSTTQLQNGFMFSNSNQCETIRFVH